MKIKITSENSGLEKGKIYDLDPASANVIIGKGFAKKMPDDAKVTAVKKPRVKSDAKSAAKSADVIKITITSAESRLVPGQVYELDAMAANVLISKGFAKEVAGKAEKSAKPPVVIDPDKPLAKYNRAELDLTIKNENIDVGGATSNKDKVAVIEAHREGIVKAEIEAYLDKRSDCDDTCRYVDGENCTLPEGYECPADPAE